MTHYCQLTTIFTILDKITIMKTVTIIGYPGALASTITGAADLFSMAGVVWQRIHGEPVEPRFNVQIASADGGPIACANGLSLMANIKIEDVLSSDIIIVPTIAGRIDDTLKQNATWLPHLKKLHDEGCDVASNDTGAFVLAEAGILDGKKATTHWGFTDLFRALYPQVDLQASQLITADGNVFCSGGGMAWFDLAIYLLERYYGHELAKQTAKAFVFDVGRHDQGAYSSIPGKKYHQDEDVLKIQSWLETNYSQSINLENLADQFSLSSRSFKRRFKAATQETPLQYLQKLRIDAAKKQLESNRKPIDEIASIVGYMDQSAFSKLFKRETALTPGEYRSRFGQR